jgi:uncharacterized membrane protein
VLDGGAHSARGAGRLRVRTVARWLALPALVAFAIVLWGGYERGWAWTGFSENDTLWDWLTLLLLPVALAVLPLWLTQRHRLHRRGRILVASALAAFGVLVLLGYLVPWAWTGFPDNHLWDWLQLLALPVAVTAVPIWIELRHEVRLVHKVVVVACVVAFAALVAAGYALHWAWTGFADNTLWDWIQLLLAPLLVPTLLVPVALAWLVVEEESAPALPPIRRT